jgi:hypothetical protein
VSVCVFMCVCVCTCTCVRVHVQGYVDSELVSESALLDLFLLAECDVLVGAFHSQVCVVWVWVGGWVCV